jgi:hypothetical protein
MDAYEGILENLQELRETGRELYLQRMKAKHNLVSASDSPIAPSEADELDDLDSELDALEESFGAGFPGMRAYPVAGRGQSVNLSNYSFGALEGSQGLEPSSDPVLSVPGAEGNKAVAIAGGALAAIALYGMLDKKKRNKWGGNKGDMSRSRRDYMKKRR